MAKEYRPYGLEQAYLLPQAPREWLPEGHLALFLEDAVSLLDIEEIAVRFKRGRGPRAYHPRMLLSLLLYGYCTGVYSSRKIEAACETDVAFRALCGGQFPDFRTVSDFRKNHLEVFAGLFIQVLGMCREAGLVKMGHLSLDGSKYQANASKHKAMSYQRIQETEPRLEAEIAELLRRSAEIDEAEDTEYGHDARGDELPEELRRREVRLAKMREAKVRLEERAERRARARAVRRRSWTGRGRSCGGQGCAPAQGAEQFHRPGQPDHEEFPRLDTGLQCSGSGGSGERSDRSPRGDAPERRQPQIGPYAGALGPKPGRYRSPGNRAVSPVIHGRCGILQRTQSGYARRKTVRCLRSHGSGETPPSRDRSTGKGQDTAALRHAVQAADA